jgi:YidC/Oxa1 family membrane protein insertase
MDNRRIFLWAGLLFVYFVVYQTWVREQRGPQQVPSAEIAADAPAIPGEVAPGDAELPALPDSEAAAAPQDLPGPSESRGPQISVRTDVFDLVIDTRGGDIRDVTLLEYPLRKSDPGDLVELLHNGPGYLFEVHTGLRTRGSGEEPNHLAQFSAAAESFVLEYGKDELIVPLRWTNADGLVVEKTYRFRRGSYRVDLEYLVENGTGAEIGAASYVQLARSHAPPKRSMTDVDSYSFIGPVFYDGRKYEKLDAEDIATEPVTAAVAGGWIASIQHHFLAAVVPAAGETYTYNSGMRRGTVMQSAIGPVKSLPPGASDSFAETLFVGPKLQDQLEATADGLKLTVDYGMLTIIAQPLFWVLNWLHKLIGNWGWAIIFLTILIKIAFYKLSETSGRSMAKMRKMQPRIKHLQERYADDRQALSKAMMELYRKEKINPASGCLPILIQMPVFIALYWVLLESVELRQAPWMLWIDDLSVRDPFFILPVLMGVTMLIQQRLNPAPPDPVQAKIMMVLPIVFTVFFAFFPAGLVIYWFTNNLLSIAQQWRINKLVGAD